MAKPTVKGQGTREKPWLLKTPSGQSEFKAYRDESLNPSAVVVLVEQDRAPVPSSLP